MQMITMSGIIRILRCTRKEGKLKIAAICRKSFTVEWFKTMRLSETNKGIQEITV